MMATIMLRLLRLHPRMSCNLHTSLCHQAKPGKVMKKVMGFNGSKSRKNRYSEAPILPTPDSFSKGSQEGRFSGSSRRSSVLNKMFMRYITDLMATGESANEFLGHGLEISRVEVTPDYKGVNVFWVARCEENDEIIEKLLKRNAGFLQHELSGLKVMGVVPMIRFVKDKQYFQILELDNRLAKADYGEDYVRTELATRLKTRLELYTPLEQKIKEQIQNMDGSLEENEIDETLPPMPQDVLGLNHSEILNRVQKLKRKSEAIHRQEKTGEDDFKLAQTVNEDPVEYGSNKERREAFREFLQKRELLRSKANRIDKNYIPDIQYLKEEMAERHRKYFENMDVYDNEEFDYLSDEEDQSVK